MTPSTRDYQRCHSRLARQIDICAVLQQALDGLDMTALSCKVNRSIALPVLPVDIVRYKQFDIVSAPILCG